MRLMFVSWQNTERSDAGLRTAAFYPLGTLDGSTLLTLSMAVRALSDRVVPKIVAARLSA